MRDLKELKLRDYRSIDDLYGNHPYLQIVEHDASGAIKDLRTHDDTFFVVFNKVSGSYEVHNVENVDNTYCFSVPALDGRMLLEARRSDTRNRSAKQLIRELREANEKLERDQRRDFLNECEGRAEEVFPIFKKTFSDVMTGNA